MTEEATTTDPFAEEEERLGGYNPSEGEEPVEEPETDPLAPAEDDPLADAAREEGEGEQEPELPETGAHVPVGEEATTPDEPSEPEPVEEPEPKPEPKLPKLKSQSRTYLALEEIEVGGEKLYKPVGTVEARNGENALRGAYRKLVEERDDYPDTTLVVVAERMFRPTPVKARASKSVAIDLG